MYIVTGEQHTMSQPASSTLVNFMRFEVNYSASDRDLHPTGSRHEQDNSGSGATMFVSQMQRNRNNAFPDREHINLPRMPMNHGERAIHTAGIPASFSVHTGAAFVFASNIV
jgi:hypothetical protein